MGDGIRPNLTVTASGLGVTGQRSRIEERRGELTSAEAEKVARDFESFMVFSMLKEMEKTTHYTKKKNNMEQTYMSLVHEKVAGFLGTKGIGIKDLLMRYIAREDAKVLQKKVDNIDK